jgi:hypothetical protein
MIALHVIQLKDYNMIVIVVVAWGMIQDPKIVKVLD